MKISCWYNDRNINIALPDSVQVDVFDLPAKRLKTIDANHWMNRGELPTELSSFLNQNRRLLIVVNDNYRPTPTARILKALRSSLDLDQTRFLVATGLHVVDPERNLDSIFGDIRRDNKASITAHSAFDDGSLCDFGAGATSVRLNKLLEWCDAILIIGSVEPHYFAGFTGGRKIILPGCASFADVERNHAYALSEDSQPLKRRGNPVWDDIQARSVAVDRKSRCAIQVVCDHEGNIFFVSQGDWDDSYNRACEFVIAQYAHQVAAKYDIVISVVYPPLDRNLYQLQKSYENVAMAVRDGGTVLLVSACRDGVGDDRFLQIAKSIADNDNVDAGDNENLVMGIHKVKRTHRLTSRINLELCSKLESSVLGPLSIKPGFSIQESVNELVNKYGHTCKIAVVLDAASQVLYLSAA